jgi:hypothetical protein
MTDQRIGPPPAALLGSGAAAPEARTVISEVRSDAAVPFDPSALPHLLERGALIQWQVDASWSQAQEIQLWLIGAPAGGWGGGAFPNREAALRDFFENLQSGTPPAPFLEWKHPVAARKPPTTLTGTKRKYEPHRQAPTR